VHTSEQIFLWAGNKKARSDLTISETVQILLDAKCDPNQTGDSVASNNPNLRDSNTVKSQNSPLQNAIQCLLPNTCRVLIEAKADISAVDEKGNNLLHQLVIALSDTTRCFNNPLQLEVDPLYSKVRQPSRNVLFHHNDWLQK
jgi:hypothetical protein